MRAKVKKLRLDIAPSDVMNSKGNIGYWKGTLDQLQVERSDAFQDGCPHAKPKAELNTQDKYCDQIIKWRKTCEGTIINHTLI